MASRSLVVCGFRMTRPRAGSPIFASDPASDSGTSMTLGTYGTMTFASKKAAGATEAPPV
jgi:hypothetical protein